MKKKIIFGVVILAVLFVVADYFGLAGLSLHKDGGVIIPFEFKFIDSKEKPINNVTITASLNGYGLGGRFEYDDNDLSVVLGRIGIGVGWRQTIFFKIPSPKRKADNKEVEFLFKHPDYIEQEKTFLVRDIKKKSHTIVLHPKAQADEQNN